MVLDRVRALRFGRKHAGAVLFLAALSIFGTIGARPSDTTPASATLKAVETISELVAGGAAHVAEAQARFLQHRKPQGGSEKRISGTTPPTPENTARRAIPPRRYPNLEDPFVGESLFAGEPLIPASDQFTFRDPPHMQLTSSGNFLSPGSPIFGGGSPPMVGSSPITTPNVPPNIVTPSAPVPEPSTWIMLILGFGFIGATMRKRPIGAPSFTLRGREGA